MTISLASVAAMSSFNDDSTNFGFKVESGWHYSGSGQYLVHQGS